MKIYRRSLFKQGKRLLDMVVAVPEIALRAEINDNGKQRLAKLYKTRKGTYFLSGGHRYYLDKDVLPVEYVNGDFTEGFKVEL